MAEKHKTGTQLPNPDEVRAERDAAYYEGFVFDASVDYPDAMFLFMYKGVKFSPLGGIQAITGQKKNGKTFFLEMLVAAALEPEAENVRSRLRGLELNPDARRMKGHPLSVMYIDTEQEPINTSRLTKGVNWLCGYPALCNHPRLHVLRLRNMPKEADIPQERLRVADYWIDRWQPDVIVLDGLRDVVHDFNDNAESTDIINRLMGLAEERNVCIWNALHYNPRPGADDVSKMRGHLGTELGNKVTDTFVSSKTKDAATGLVSFKAKQTDARSKDVPDIPYEVTTERDGEIEIAVPRIIDAPDPLDPGSQPKPEPQDGGDLDIDGIARVLYGAEGFEWPNSKRNILELFSGHRREPRNKYFAQAIEARLLIVDKSKSIGGYHPYRLNPNLNPYDD